MYLCVSVLCVSVGYVSVVCNCVCTSVYACYILCTVVYVHSVWFIANTTGHPSTLPISVH